MSNRREDILVRKKLIDAAEGHLVSVVDEFEHAFDILEKYEKTVSIFGSARLSSDTKGFQDAYRVSQALAKHGYAIVTGGGCGVMEAANKGAYDLGKPSIGFNIELPTEQKLNPYTTDHYSFEHFFGRKVALTLQADAYVYCAGGFGTLDELFEIVTLEQTGKVPRNPIILFGSEFWRPIMNAIEFNLNERHHTISPEDKEILQVSDDVDEVVAIIEANQTAPKPKPQGAKFGVQSCQ